MSDPIRAALDEAAKRLCFGHNGEDCDMCVAPEHCYKAHTFLRKDAAAAIAAFLRALPVTRSPTIEECQKARTTTVRPRINYAPDILAAEVEEAARRE